MMKKSLCCLLLLVLTLFFSFGLSPDLARADSLLVLQINEELTPGQGEIRLTVTGIMESGIKQQIKTGLVWKSSAPSIATVSSNGELRFTGKGGSVTITVQKGSASGSKTVFVKPWVRKVEIETDLVYSPNPYRLLAKGKFSDGTERYLGPEDDIIWTSTNPWVAWVNSQGVVTFTGEEGRVTIRAIVGDLEDNVSEKVDLDSKEQKKAKRKGIKIKEDLVYSSEPQQLTLVVVMTDDSEETIPNDAADWSSSNPDVATISKSGELTFTGKAGFTTIAVSYGGYKYEKLVTVNKFLTKLAINQSLQYTPLWADIYIPLSATATYNDGTKIIRSSGLNWSVSDEGLATITEDGQLKLTGKAGTLTITVSGEGSEGTTVEDSLTVEIPAHEKPIPKKLFIHQNPVNFYSSDGIYHPTVTCIYHNGERRDVTEHVTWTSLTPETAAVFQNKVYLAANPGNVELVAGFQGISAKISGSSRILPGVNDGRIYSLLLKEHQLPFSFSPVQLTALGVRGDGSLQNVTSQVNWHSSQPGVATVKNGRLTFTGRIGKTLVTAQGFGLRTFLEVEVSPEDLLPRVVELKIEGNLEQGANPLKAVAQFSNGLIKDVTKEVVWNTSNKNVAVVSKDGVVMFVNGFGPVTISASYGGNEAQISRK